VRVPEPRDDERGCAENGEREEQHRDEDKRQPLADALAFFVELHGNELEPRTQQGEQRCAEPRHRAAQAAAGTAGRAVGHARGVTSAG
jgi:hypothetical protein